MTKTQRSCSENKITLQVLCCELLLSLHTLADAVLRDYFPFNWVIWYIKHSVTIISVNMPDVFQNISECYVRLYCFPRFKNLSKEGHVVTNEDEAISVR